MHKLLLTGLIALSFSFANPCSNEADHHRGPSKNDTVHEVEVTYPEFVSVPKTHESEGTFEASEIFNITANATGSVDELFVSNGDTVGKEDPIISIANTELLERIDIKRAKIKEFNARLKEIQAKLDLTDNEDGPITLQDTDFLDEDPIDEPTGKNYGDPNEPNLHPKTLKTLAEVLETYVDRLTKEADALDRQLLELTHNSPVNGIITKMHVSEGNKVDKKDVMVEISKNNPLSISFELPQGVASFVDKHSRVRVIPEGAKESKGQGQVYFISPNLTSGSQRILVKAHVSNDQGLLKGGQTATLYVTTRKMNRVIKIAKSALFYEDDKTYVFIAYRGRAKLVEVKIGDEDDDNNVEIFGDLRVDDPIIVDRPKDLKHNSFVKIAKEGEEESE
jgi:multidrug efflux pump subunit AcrA (membrane-fusion protein)